MNFAFLAIDAQTRALAHTVVAVAEHRLVGIWLDPRPPAGGAAEIESLASIEEGPLRDLTSEFDSDVAAAGAECVVVAYHADAALLHDRVRRLLARGMAVVVSLPVNLSVMAHYELEMVAGATDLPCVPLMPLRGHPAAQQFLEIAGCPGGAPATSRLGQIEQITFDRYVGTATHAEIMRAVAADVDLVRQIGGDVHEVSAMGAFGQGDVVLPVNVQMAGRLGVLARWSAMATEGDTGASATIQGCEGRATLKMPTDQPWILEVETAQSATSRSWQPEDAAQARLEYLVKLLTQLPADTARRGEDWEEAGRCLEVTEACDKSLRKGRTVHLQYEARDEASAFKGTMASLGCALLLLGTGIMVLSAVFLKLAKVNGFDRLAAFLGKVPYALLAVLLVFLVLQLFRLVIPRAAEKG